MGKKHLEKIDRLNFGKAGRKKGRQKMANNYYPFGLTFNSYQRVTAKENKYNTFQDQEKITALDLNWIQFKWRNHDPTIGRFFNVDPLAEDYYYNSIYAFSENQVISFVELEGLERAYRDPSTGTITPASDHIRHEPPSDAQFLHDGLSVKKELSAGDKMLNGTGNMVFGIVGAVASVAYIAGTEGVGAGVGGALALSASLGEVAIGGAQFAEGVSQLFDGPTDESGVLQEANTIPGLAAYGNDLESAGLIDAGTQMLPALFSGNIGIFDSFKTVKPNLQGALNSTDAVMDISDLLRESYETYDRITTEEDEE